MNRLFPRDFRKHGFALVIALAFIVLLTGVAVAFFSLAVSERKVSNSSAGNITVELLAEGALETVIGDLRQEIAAGSSGTSIVAGGVSTTLYRPKSPCAAVPSLALAGTSGQTAFAPNLVKRSAYQQPFYTGAVYNPIPAIPDRASPVSCSGTSQNGRSLSLARWNKALLLPKANTGSDTDLTPITTGSNVFVSPDWILIGRDGSNPVTLAAATEKNTAAVGRYAYVIYNEGGILDANVAGYPNSVLSVKDVASKPNVAFADLLQLTAADGSSLFKNGEIEALVGWRNHASAQASGSLESGYVFSSGSSYCQYVTANPNGFISVSGSYNGQSDRLFVSRQQLVEFFLNGIAKSASDRARLQNALMYLGTFSRDLNQPSFAPDPALPQILSNTAADNYAGNDAAGHREDINPALLSVRVSGTFARNDQSVAIIGEPLIKRRFALNRLAWLTYAGPSASRNLSDPDMKALLNAGLSEAFLQQGDDAAILRYFGLTWDKDKGCWNYSHGITGSVGQPIIGYLAKVRDASREPDFFELLKATINAGAIAKGATNPAGVPEEARQYAYDTKLDYAILQIGANIMDQFDTDGFPTRIRFNDGAKDVEIRGVENLPYYYRVRHGNIVAEMPAPAPTLNDSYHNYSANTPAYDQLAEPYTSASSLTKTGYYCILYEPEIWNPHDVNGSLGTPRPTSLRIVADGAPLDANGKALGSYNINQNLTCMWATGKYYSYNLNTSKTPASYNTQNPAYTSTFEAENTALTFTDNNGALFREPTLLAKPGIPSGSGLALGPNHTMRKLYADPLLAPYAAHGSGNSVEGINALNDLGGSTTPYLGFHYGIGPLRWVFTVSGSNMVASANTNNVGPSNVSGAYGTTYRMQYSPDSGVTWITYDEKYVVSLNYGTAMNVKKDGSQDLSANAAIGLTRTVNGTDPRTNRFGSPGGSTHGSAYAMANTPFGTFPASTTAPPADGAAKPKPSSFWVDFSNNVLMSDRWGTSSGYGCWDSACALSMPLVGGWYPSPAANWAKNPVPANGVYYRPGLLSQNNPLAISDGFALYSQPDAALSQYYSDPDGVVRRAMGAYVTPSATAPATTTIGLPMARTAGVGAVANQSQSRPIILNRPFRSVAELGYVFSGTPWKNLSMFTPESGEAGLLDAFCIQPDVNTGPLVAGKVDLNTRQAPILQAILAGTSINDLGGVSTIPSGEAKTIAYLLVGRTSDLSTPGKGPLTNVAELVGRWKGSVAASQGGIHGAQSFSGFSEDLASTDLSRNNIQRFRETAIRSLSNAGTARVWTLMIDLVVQTGRYPAMPRDLSQFVVEGERRYWLHLAIDRWTGSVIDQQLEVVRE